jgi:hypothetical protein
VPLCLAVVILYGAVIETGQLEGHGSRQHLLQRVHMVAVVVDEVSVGVEVSVGDRVSIGLVAALATF